MGQWYYPWHRHPTLLDSRASLFFWRGGSSGVFNACIWKKQAIPNKQDLSHSCFLSFFYSSNITSRISVTLNFPFNWSASWIGLEHKKILLYCIYSNRLLVFTGWFWKWSRRYWHRMITYLSVYDLIDATIHINACCPPRPRPDAFRFVLDASL